jgi:hypothetical protein
MKMNIFSVFLDNKAFVLYEAVNYCIDNIHLPDKCNKTATIKTKLLQLKQNTYNFGDDRKPSRVSCFALALNF